MLRSLLGMLHPVLFVNALSSSEKNPLLILSFLLSITPMETRIVCMDVGVQGSLFRLPMQVVQAANSGCSGYQCRLFR